MIKGVDKTIEWIRLNNLVRFTIKTSGGDNNNIFKTGDSETFEDSIKRFQEVMRISFAGKFIIEGSQDNNKSTTRGLFKEEFSNFEGYGDIQPVPANVGNVVTVDEVEKRISEALERDREKRKLLELEDENKELKRELKERDTPFNNFIGTIMPYATEILSKVVTGAKVPAPVSIGVLDSEDVESEPVAQEESEVQEASQEDIERLQKCLVEWAEFEPNISEVIEGIVRLYNENPAQYNMAKNMLIK